MVELFNKTKHPLEQKLLYSCFFNEFCKKIAVDNYKLMINSINQQYKLFSITLLDILWVLTDKEGKKFDSVVQQTTDKVSYL